jgi:uncharacterized protein involved in type VI secretion and phage assembly
MMDLSTFASASAGSGRSDRIYGVVVGVVTNNQDPDQLGRVKVKFPWLSDTDESHWARIATPMGGAERGFFFIPDVNDEVLVVFEQGMKDRPYILGALWNTVDKAPSKVADDANALRYIASKVGNVIEFDDTEKAPKITIRDKKKKTSIEIDTKNSKVTIKCGADVKIETDGKISFENPKGDVSFNCNNMTIKTAANLDIKASGGVTAEGTTGFALTCAAGVSLNDPSLVVMK